MKVTELMRLMEEENENLNLTFVLYSDGSGHIASGSYHYHIIDFSNKEEMSDRLNELHRELSFDKIKFEL